MDPHKMRQIQSTLRQLAEEHARTVAVCLRDAVSVLGIGFSQIGPILHDRQPPTPAIADTARVSCRILDPQMLSVVYRGKRCFLGNTLPYRFLVRLAAQPNRYVSYETLLDEVWRNRRSKEAVRSVVKVLRSKLRHAGLGAVATVIDGQVREHYALMIDRLR